MRAVYATVERVMRAADIKASAYVKDEIVDALESSSDAVDRIVNLGDATRPGFAPWQGSITFDWPVPNNGNAYKFWLNQFRLHSLTSLVSGGDALTADALPWPASGPPYSAVEIDTEATDTLDIGDSGTGQRSLIINGVWCIFGEDRTRTAWTLGTTANASTTTLNLSAPIGIGSIVTIGTERVIVEDRAWADSGQTASALTANVASQSITVSSGSAFLAGEDILIDSERMLVREVAGNVLTVQRAVSGSTLAAHTLGATVYWARSCTVERGALGTTAASHTSGDAVSIYRAPALVEQLTIAYALDRRAQESAGYARTIGQGESERNASGRGIAELERRLIERYGRIRHRAV
jgi:hypothetical protein